MLVCATAAAFLAGCADPDSGTGQPSFYRSLAQTGVQLDANTAASMISGYRKNNGLGPVTIDPALMRLADQQAHAMARSDKLDHNAGGSLMSRMKASGYPYKASAENIGAGYYTLAEAFSGWRDSPPHRAKMLLKDVTRMGIAAVYQPNTKYKVFWTLILAAPQEKQGGVPGMQGQPTEEPGVTVLESASPNLIAQ
ncbi:MAG: CAP domain-containing protein [Xanthobacteraceae bacterium]